MVSKGKFKEEDFEAPVIVARKQEVSLQLKNDLKIYSPKEREAIMGAIMRDEVPGIKYREDKGYFDYKGKKEEAKGAYQEVALQKIDKIADKVEKQRMADALNNEKKKEQIVKIVEEISKIPAGEILKTERLADIIISRTSVEKPRERKGNPEKTETAKIDSSALDELMEKNERERKLFIAKTSRELEEKNMSPEELFAKYTKELKNEKPRQNLEQQEIVLTKEKKKKKESVVENKE